MNGQQSGIKINWLAYVGLAGLLFGGYQYLARSFEQQGADRAVLAEVREMMKEQKQAVREHQQLITDLRVQVADLARLSRFLHGEGTPR